MSNVNPNQVSVGNQQESEKLYNIKMGHINIRSINNCFNTFHTLIEMNKFSIVGVTETWLSDGFPDQLIAMTDYNVIRLDRNGRGGGVAWYLKNSYKYKVYFKSISETVEQLWITV